MLNGQQPSMTVNGALFEKVHTCLFPTCISTQSITTPNKSKAYVDCWDRRIMAIVSQKPQNIGTLC